MADLADNVVDLILVPDDALGTGKFLHFFFGRIKMRLDGWICISQILVVHEGGAVDVHLYTVGDVGMHIRWRGCGADQNDINRPT